MVSFGQGEDGRVEKIELFFDESGKHIKSIYYSAEGNIRGITELEYDIENEDPVRIKYYSPDNTLMNITEYRDDCIYKASYFDEDGNLEVYSLYLYDDSGNLIGTEFYYADGTLMSRDINE